MKNNSISVLQLSVIFITSSGLLNHVTVIPVLLNVTGKDSWISVCLASLFCILWLPVLRYTIRSAGGRPFVQWLHEHWGAGAWIILIPLLVTIFGMGATTLKETTTWTKITYLPGTPLTVIVLTLILISLAAARSGLKALAVTAGILLPFIVLFGYFVMLGNIPHKDYTLLRPFLENGIRPALQGVIYAASGLSELFLVVMLQHRIKGNIGYSSLLILIVILAGLTIGPLTGAIAEFGTPEAAKQRYPAYEQWRVVQIGRFIEHMDFLSIYQWLAGAFVRISFSLWLIGETLSFWFNGRKRGVLFAASAGMLLFAISPLSDSSFFHLLTVYYLPASVSVLIGASIIARMYALLFNVQGGAQP
ncbi:endospore germination permease [Paenibacillus tyrfis]|uniref:endospore germination permease n=1 Tax=Paenibacillus tyrfis TaxID=1501230 RepID=UPI0020A150C6|nr:endospore germination permease [Paenibacillus tyrfis]MCP1309052.1 endospore germination permease [Paenibacillus tyrfis]